MPLSALQAALPLLDLANGEAGDSLPIRILAEVPAVLARRQQKNRPALDSELPLAAQIFQGLGARRLPAHVADAALILYADHELAASTFAARITAAAGAGLYDGVSAALAVLKGPLHGGSLPAAARLLRGLAAATNSETEIERILALTQRIPGFGHSVYRGGDPRAGHFRRLAKQIAQHDASRWLELALRLEERVLQERGLYSNVDLYAVTFLHAAGIPDDMMIGVFAVARTAGWLGHMLEQRHNNRLIRPRAHYSGQVGRQWE
jgi:citrate synthase